MEGVKLTGQIGDGRVVGFFCFLFLFCPMRAFIETEKKNEARRTFFVCLYKHSRNTSQHLRSFTQKLKEYRVLYICFLILCSISVWDLFSLCFIIDLGLFFILLLFVFVSVCTKVKQWPVRCVG